MTKNKRGQIIRKFRKKNAPAEQKKENKYMKIKTQKRK